MVKVLITDASILTLSTASDIYIDRGYIYIQEGIIQGIGKGDPPEEFQYPELLINGEGRLIIPGLSSGITSLTLYPLRFEVKSMNLEEYSNYLSTLSRTDCYYAAVLSLTEMVSRGVTSAMISDIFLDNVARAANDVGIYVTLASPIDIGLKDYDPYNELKLILRRWHDKSPGIKAAVYAREKLPEEIESSDEAKAVRKFVSNASNVDLAKREDVVLINPSVKGDRSVRYGDGIKDWSPGEGLGIGVRPSYSMIDVIREAVWRGVGHPLDVLVSSALDTHRLIGFEELGSIDVGKRANVVMFDTSEPPGWPVPRDLNSVVTAIIEGNLRVETVIVGDDIVVDNKEILTIGTDVIKRAIRRLEGLLTKK